MYAPPVNAAVSTIVSAVADVLEGRPLGIVAEVRVAEAGVDGARAVVGDVPLAAVRQGHQWVVYGAQQHPRGEALAQRG